MINPAPSEEFVLHCDVKGCQAQVSMVSGVTRSEHDWGKAIVCLNQPPPTLRDGTPIISGVPLEDWGDYDLCPEHYRGLKDFLGGPPRSL